MLSFFATYAFAGEIYNNALLAKDIIRAISYFFNPLCVLGLAFSIIQIMLGTNQKTVSNGIGFAKSIIVAFIIFNCLGTIINYADKLQVTTTYKFNEISSIESVMDSKKSRESKGNGGTIPIPETTNQTNNK